MNRSFLACGVASVESESVVLWRMMQVGLAHRLSVDLPGGNRS